MNRSHDNMDRDIEELANIVDTIGSNQVLRIHFCDGDIYDLHHISVVQDLDEDTPHATATVTNAVVQKEKISFLIKPGSAIFFHLVDIARVENAATKEILFTAV